MSRVPRHDITLFGATGFVGRLTAKQLQRRCAEEGLSLCLAGRRHEALQAVAEDVSGTGSAPEIQMADSSDYPSLQELAARSRVVCSTVGPYARYGTPLVNACIEAGSDYCDLTGEIQWIRRLIDSFGDSAERKAVRIVNCCGFDSVPSDLGVLLAQEERRRGGGEISAPLEMRLIRQAGGVSRGTIESLIELLEEAKQSPEVRALLKDPHSLETEWSPPGSAGTSIGWRDRQGGEWRLPFLMEAVNGRIVRRSNALLGYPYGREFEYHEVIPLGSGIGALLRALGGRIGLAALPSLLAFRPTRALISKLFFPPLGGGPAIALEGRGYFETTISEPGDRSPIVTISGDRDPGYGATAIMLAEAAIALTTTTGKHGGIETPATALGVPYAKRLHGQGVRFFLGDRPLT